MSGSTTRLSKTTQYRLVSSTVSKVLVLASRLILWGLCTGMTRDVFGLRDFVEDVLFEGFVIQLSLLARVEGEAVYLAFYFTLMGSVPVILGASGSEFDDMIV